MEGTEAKTAISRGTYIEQIMTDMKNGVLALDKKGNVLYANPQMNAFFEKETLAGQTVHSLMYEHETPENDAFWDTMIDVIHGHAIHYQKRVRFTAPSGRRYFFHIVCSYLSGSTEGVVITVADETENNALLEKKHDTTIVLISMLLMVCMTVLVSELHTFLHGAFPHTWIARFTEIASVINLFILLKYTGLTIKDFGIFPKKPMKELGEALLVVAVMAAGMAGAKLVLLAGGSTLFAEGAPFIDFSAPPDFYYLKYIVIVLAQEFLTKCGLQKSINRVLDSKHGSILATVVTAILFMALHVQHGLIYMLGAGALCAVLAVLYNRHNSLLGCSIVHYAFGILGLILGWIV